MLHADEEPVNLDAAAATRPSAESGVIHAAVPHLFLGLAATMYCEVSCHWASEEALPANL